jgi:hypothetical protein
MPQEQPFESVQDALRLIRGAFQTPNRPNIDPNYLPVGTIRRGSNNDSYWIIVEKRLPNGLINKLWVSYDGPVSDSDLDSESTENNNDQVPHNTDEDTDEDNTDEEDEDVPPPNINPNSSPVGTIVRGVYGIYWITAESSLGGNTWVPLTPNQFPRPGLIPFWNNDTQTLEFRRIRRGIVPPPPPQPPTPTSPPPPPQPLTQTEKKSKHVIEEDSNNYTDDTTSETSITSDDDDSSKILSKCLNDSPVSLVEYDQTDLNDLFIIYNLNSNKEFIKGSCLKIDEMKDFLRSNLIQNINTELPQSPTNIMAICTTPSPQHSLTGFSSKPTGKLVVRIPTNNIFVTYGSMKKVFSSTNKEWYALPLYGGKKRRIGNLGGIYGSSMNHCQVPGFQVYKLYTRQEIKSRVKITETTSDYPHTFLNNKIITLFDIIGKDSSVSMINKFINSVINELLEITPQSVFPIIHNYFA